MYHKWALMICVYLCFICENLWMIRCFTNGHGWFVFGYMNRLSVKIREICGQKKILI